MNKQIVPCQNNWGLTYWNIWIKETRSHIKLWHYSNFHKILNLENFALNGFQKVFPKYFVMFKRFLLSEEMFETIIIMHILFLMKITLYYNNCLPEIKNDHTPQAITANDRGNSFVLYIGTRVCCMHIGT